MRYLLGGYTYLVDGNGGARDLPIDPFRYVSESAIAVQGNLTLESIADAVHPHPTLPEGLKEAAENALGRAIHTVNR